MKYVIRFLLLGALAWSAVACVQGGDPQPDPPDDGMEELLDTAGVGGWVEASLGFDVGSATVDIHPGLADDRGPAYLRATFDLLTPGGHPLRAVGLLWRSDGDDLGVDDLGTAGAMQLRGQVFERGGLQAIAASADLDLLTSGGTVAAQAALLVIGADAFFDEADAIFLGDAHLRPAEGSRLSDGVIFPYLAAGVEGVVVGVLQGWGDERSFGEMEVWLSYRAERWTTPFGTVQWLNGYVEDDGEAKPTAAIAFDLRPAQQPDMVVLACGDCDGDVLLAVPTKGFTATDDLWLKIRMLPAIPRWAAGQDEVPLPERFTCPMALSLAADAVRAANSYRLHQQLLADGATLALVQKTVTVHQAGTDAHAQIVDRLHDAEQSAWGAATFLLEQAEARPCVQR